MAEENEELLRRLWEEFRGEGKMELADELLAPDYVDHDPNNPQESQGPEAAKEDLGPYRTAFPDMKITVSDLESEGDTATGTWKVTATHSGDLMGIAPTGNKVEVVGKSKIRVEGGKIAEEWEEWSMEDLLSQVGATPADIKAG